MSNERKLQYLGYCLIQPEMGSEGNGGYDDYMVCSGTTAEEVVQDYFSKLDRADEYNIRGIYYNQNGSFYYDAGYYSYHFVRLIEDNYLPGHIEITFKGREADITLSEADNKPPISRKTKRYLAVKFGIYGIDNYMLCKGTNPQEVVMDWLTRGATTEPRYKFDMDRIKFMEDGSFYYNCVLDEDIYFIELIGNTVGIMDFTKVVKEIKILYEITHIDPETGEETQSIEEIVRTIKNGGFKNE